MTDTAGPEVPYRYISPPLGLEVTLASRSKQTCEVHVRMKSGNHTYVHRMLEGDVDWFGALDIVVEAALYRWIHYLLESDTHRRRGDSEWIPGPHSGMPAWPAPGRLTEPSGADDRPVRRTTGRRGRPPIGDSAQDI